MTARNVGRRGKRVPEAEFRRMWADPTLKLSDIAARLDVSWQAVTCRARTRGLPPRPGGAGLNRKIDRALFVAMWAANVSPTSMAEYFGVCRENIHLRARRWGLPARGCTRWSVITVAEFAQAQLARRMAVEAQATRAAMRLSEMVDAPSSKRSAA